MSATITIPDLAEVLFASVLQESEHPSPTTVRTTVERLLARDHGREDCLAYVATEAGDHPETYVHRMQWALHTIEEAYAAPSAYPAAA